MKELIGDRIVIDDHLDVRAEFQLLCILNYSTIDI